MASLRLKTYSTSVVEEQQHEMLFVDFDADYSDIFPSPIHLQQFLQKFFDLLWKSLITSSNETSTTTTTICKMHKFSVVGGDDESLDVQFSLISKSPVVNGEEEKGEEFSEVVKTAQAFLPDDDEIMIMHKEFMKANGGCGRRMNDGGEYVDDDDEGEDYY